MPHMAVIQDLAPDEPLQAELLRIVELVTDDEAVAYAHSSPAFQGGGFRAGHAGRIRARLGQLLAAAAPIDDALRRLLAHHSLNATVVAPLSATFLSDHYDNLTALFGAAPLQAAMLLDGRQPVRAQAARRLRQQPGSAPPAPPAAAAALRAALGALGERLATRDADGDAPGPAGAPASPGAAPANLQLRLQECQAELRRLKGAAQRAERLAQRLDDAGAELLAARAARDEAQTEARAACRRAATAESELARDRAHTELQVRTLVETRLAQEFAGWLSAPRARLAEAAAANQTADVLLRRAAAALAAQAQADRVSGQRAELQERLASLEAALERGRDALAHAMRPLPELSAAVRDLDAESVHLRRLLDLDSASPLRLTLAAAINSAPSGQLAELRALGERLAALGALDPAEHALIDATARRRLAALTLAAGPPAIDKDAAEETPAGRLRAALTGRAPAILLVDGHNALFSLQARYLPPQLHGVPDREARARLVNDLVAMAAERPACRVWVVFDGPRQSDSSPAPNVRVSYSGGTGENRADRLLVESVRFFTQGGAEAVLLATNDGELAARAVRMGARILPPAEMLPLLG